MAEEFSKTAANASKKKFKQAISGERMAEAGAATQKLTLKNVVIDDWFFGVSAVSAQGDESPVVFPGDPGAF